MSVILFNQKGRDELAMLIPGTNQLIPPVPPRKSPTALPRLQETRLLKKPPTPEPVPAGPPASTLFIVPVGAIER